MKPRNQGIAVAKAIFDPTFDNGVVFGAIINETKDWFQKQIVCSIYNLEGNGSLWWHFELPRDLSDESH